MFIDFAQEIGNKGRKTDQGSDGYEWLPELELAHVEAVVVQEGAVAGQAGLVEWH